MLTNDLLVEAYSRVRDNVRAIVDGLDEDLANKAPQSGANTIGWILWHLTRVQDDHIAEMLDSHQIWISQGWCTQFGLPCEPDATGYGFTPEQVAEIHVQPDLLGGYYNAVHERTIEYINRLSEADYSQIIDRNWEPPVTRMARLVSILADDLQHVGQAAYIKGLLQ